CICIRQLTAQKSGPGIFVHGIHFNGGISSTSILELPNQIDPNCPYHPTAAPSTDEPHHRQRQTPTTMSTKYAFGKALKEVRFLFCQTGEHSAATRSFLARTYPTMKKHNPQTPILIREAAGTLPKIYARYEFGVEKSQSLEGLSDKQIEETVSGLVKGSA
ncbi:nadh-ubiquinone oxidoreductase 105 kda subunit, partial [Colletotrichum chrysophilum]